MGTARSAPRFRLRPISPSGPLVASIHAIEPLKECSGSDDADALVGTQDEQILIAGNDGVRIGGYSCSQHDVVSSIAADLPRQGHWFNNQDRPAKKIQEGCYDGRYGEFGSKRDIEFIEQRLRSGEQAQANRSVHELTTEPVRR